MEFYNYLGIDENVTYNGAINKNSIKRMHQPSEKDMVFLIIRLKQTRSTQQFCCNTNYWHNRLDYPGDRSAGYKSKKNINCDK